MSSFSLPRTPLFAVLAPIAAGTLYVIYLHSSLTRKVQCNTTYGIQPTSAKLPDELDKAKDPNLIIIHEQATKVVSNSSLPDLSLDHMLTVYIRDNMVRFSNYPFTLIIYFLCPAESRRSFSKPYLSQLPFHPGDRVCGAYVVHDRATLPNSAKLSIYLDAPKGFSGPALKGVIAVSIERLGKNTVFTNDVVMWRGSSEKALPLEGRLGRYLHTIIATALVEGGTNMLVALKNEEK